MPEESTTPDLVERVRRAAEPANVRDYDALMRFWAPGGVLDLSHAGLGRYEGHAALRALFEDWIGAYDDFQIEIDEVRDLGNGVALAMVVQNARPAGSKGFVRGNYASVYTWSDGLIERITNYADVNEARAAAERLAESRG